MLKCNKLLAGTSMIIANDTNLVLKVKSNWSLPNPLNENPYWIKNLANFPRNLYLQSNLRRIQMMTKVPIVKMPLLFKWFLMITQMGSKPKNIQSFHQCLDQIRNCHHRKSMTGDFFTDPESVSPIFLHNKIENSQNWKFAKLKIRKIENSQNWKFTKLKIHKNENS